MTVDPATRKAQADASNPRGSAFVSANAGSGKTFVLARRVVRLLLAGTDPGRILCLTFTKAAAAEMAKRVFAELSEWTSLSDAKLAAKIAEIEGRRPDADMLKRARRLFAEALETPGGLKIQTIHAFCERLLHQFPFEANVAGHFEVLDQRDAEALADDARRSVLARAARDPDGHLGRALKATLGSASDMMNEVAITEFIRNRDRLRAWIAANDTLAGCFAELRAVLGVGAGETAASLRVAALEECALVGRLEEVHRYLAGGGKLDADAAARLEPALTAQSHEDRAGAYLDFWQTGSGDLRAPTRLITNASKAALAVTDEWLDEERARLEALLDRIAAAACYESTVAMLTLVDAAIGAYTAAKTARGVLDFEDLIVKTANLLTTRGDASSWIHYKLDRGLDHILVDEAQDTSPRQWQVVRALAEEFFAGAGATDATRTLFAVGDEKQSIFSFQGAVPAWFSRVRRELGERARSAGLAWTTPELHLSFRSVPVVLDAVDRVFATEIAYRGLSGEPQPPIHAPWRQNQPGRVILWPMIEPPPKIEPQDWTTPLDHLGEKSPEVQLAERIALTIRGWLQRGELLEATEKNEAGKLENRPIRPGGILILTRTRGAQTDAINRALKTRGVPIAGADRLTLTDHIAVMDLMALARVVLLPEDDLSLAALLKSPLIGLDEDQLFAIAHNRRYTLFDGLARAATEKGEPFMTAWRTIQAWRSMADTRDPHAFYARILGGPDKGREKILKRLGSEAEDVIDEFLAQTLAYERANTPSLQGFLAWLEATETEIRRDTETLRDEVRVMTVHGAKGLEADIVFLVDTGMQPVHPTHDARVVALAEDRDGSAAPLVWMRRFRAMPAVVKARVEALREAGREEYRRLLYVAMTRARDRLYVCGTEKQISDRDRALRWHNLIAGGLEAEATRIENADGTLAALEWRADRALTVPPKPKQEGMSLRPQQPPWLKAEAPPPPPALRRVTPSAALAGDDPPNPFAGASLAMLTDRSAASALVRGRLIHRLLESLPGREPEEQRVAGARYLAALAPNWPEPERTALLNEALAIMAHPAFAPVFAPGSRAEIDIGGAFGRGILSGRIDRLAVTGDRVLIVDYKTNRPAPERIEDAPQDYVIQLALYRTVLQRLYPGKSVAAAILWTDRPSLMEIPSAALDAAASRVQNAMQAGPGREAPDAGLAP